MKAKLLEIDSSKENKEIWKEIKKRGFKWQKKQFWLGLTDRRREGQWVYESTGRVFVFVFLLSMNLNCDTCRGQGSLIGIFFNLSPTQLRIVLTSRPIQNGTTGIVGPVVGPSGR